MFRASAWSRLAALSLAVVATAAFGAGQRSFVRSDAVDNPSCSLASPCRTFGAAITATSTGGEVIVLDSAGYGTVAITKSVAIIAAPGVYAGITVPAATDGVTINGAGIHVRLKGLTITGQNASGTGIRFLQGASLAVENCSVTNLGLHSISVEAVGTITVTDSAIAGSNDGLNVNAGAMVAVVRSSFERNGFGVVADNGGNVSILDTAITGNGNEGVLAAASTSATTRVAIESSLITDHVQAGVHATPVHLDGSVRLHIARSTISRNDQGVQVDAQGPASAIVSVTGNQIVDNVSNGIFAQGAFATIRASLNTIIGSNFGFLQALTGKIYTQGNNVVRDNGTDDGGHVADTPL